MSKLRVLVLGGYGFFGQRLVRRLAGMPGLHILVAGRSVAAARALADGTPAAPGTRLEAVVLDADAPLLADALRALAPGVLVNAAGPFQGADYRVASACIATGVHAIDLADGRAHVTGIGRLDAAAVAAGVAVVSGASSVPALSAAAADHLARDLRTVRSIDIGISPGNRTERGLSTVRGILSYCGKALPTQGGQRVIGWSGSWRHAYAAPVGTRLLSPCDVPDLALFPARYPGHPEVRFGAGLELAFLHRGMNALAWLAARGVVADWSAHARVLKWLGDRFRHGGSDAGAMHVTVCGEDAAGRTHTRTWELLACEGHGPYVPTLAAAALVRRLHAGPPLPLGARPCVGLLALADFTREAAGLSITTAVAQT